MQTIEHIVQILREFDIEPKPLDRLLSEYMRGHRSLGSHARRFISDVVFGVMRWRRRLDGCLMMQGLRRPKAKERALAHIAWKRPAGDDFNKYNELARECGVSTDIEAYDIAEMPKKFPGGAAAFYSYPDFLYKGLRKSFGNDAVEEIAQKLNQSTFPTLRVNTLRASREEILGVFSDSGISAMPTKKSPFGIRLDRRIDKESDLFRDGLVEIQDEASQLAAIIANPRPGESMLDVCAGAGGKSLASAMLMKNDGRIVASDINDAKLKELRRRASRAGVTCIETLSAHVLADRENFKGVFDLVLVDAPCSGSGTLRRSPDIKWRLSSGDVKSYVATQKKLLAESARFVKPGGRLVYVTCSFLRDENDDVMLAGPAGVNFKIADAGCGLRQFNIDDDGLLREDGSVKTDPRIDDWDSFFIAVWQREGEDL